MRNTYYDTCLTLTTLTGNGYRDYLKVLRDRPSGRTVRIDADPYAMARRSVEDAYKLFALMLLLPQHRFLVCTSNPRKAAFWFANPKWLELTRAYASLLTPNSSEDFADVEWPLPNVWMGTTVKDQAEVDGRVGHLLCVPAVCHYVHVVPVTQQVRLDSVRNPGGTGWVSINPFKKWSEGRPLLGLRPPSPPSSLDVVILSGAVDSGKLTSIDAIRKLIQQCSMNRTKVFVNSIGDRPFSSVAEEGMNGLPDKPYEDSANWPADLALFNSPRILL